MSQADAAIALGWVRNEVANVERQRRRVIATEIAPFARLFRVDRKKKRLLEPMRKLERDDGFNYKSERSRD